MPFTPTTLGTCTDAGNVVDYQISTTGISTDSMKISIDGANNLIDVTVLTTSSETGPLTISVVETTPDNNVEGSGWSFTVLESYCI